MPRYFIRNAVAQPGLPIVGHRIFIGYGSQNAYGKSSIVYVVLKISKGWVLHRVMDAVGEVLCVGITSDQTGIRECAKRERKSSEHRER